MLSICIPTYNYDVEKLVSDLSRQCEEASVEFEILVLEDGSDEKFVNKNNAIESIRGAKHIVSRENFGRSVTRNRLAYAAKYGKLIFIDCDTG